MDLLIADDAAVVAHAEQDLQRITSCIADVLQLFGYRSASGKLVLYKPIPKKNTDHPTSTFAMSN